MDRPLINAIRDLLLGCALAVLVYSQPAFPADATTSARVPIEAELIGKLDAARAKMGSAVYAKVLVRWQNKDVTFEAGTILKGRIVGAQARSKTNRNSELALRFDSVEFTRNDTRPIPLTLTAVMAPGESAADSSEYQPLSNAVGLTLGSSSTGAGGPGVATPTSGVRSLSAAATTVYLQPRLDRQPKTIHAGQVIGIRGVKLSVGGGPEGSSLLYSSARDVRLASRSLLAFIASATPTASSSGTAVPGADTHAGSSVSGGATAGSANLSAETEVCSPPECNEALSVDVSPDTASTSAISTKDIGYTTAANRAMFSFDYASAIAYLNSNELLFTFNPHELVPRDKEDAAFPGLHTVRAVVLNLTTKKAERTVDWKVYDANQYLWSAGPDRVLVHVGRELRLYGPHLKLLRTLAVDGPVSFVKSSPAQTYFAVGTLRERHSDAVHRQLEEAEGREPEEDVEVQILDAQFHVLATVLQSSRAVPPVLSDHGEFGAFPLGHGRWRIEEDLWAGPKRVLTQVSSACRLQMTSLPHDLLFMVGCDRQPNGRWYRILRRDGKPMLKGWSPSTDLEHMVLSNTAGDLFAVSVVKSTKAIAHASIFQSSDLESQQIGVYRVDNGKRISAFRIAPPVRTRQSFALSPRGDQLAVLTNDRISFYKVAGT